MKTYVSISAVLMAMVMTVGVAAAGSVNIGMGRMDSGDFETLKQMVRGTYEAAPQTPDRPVEHFAVAEFNGPEVAAIEQAMGHAMPSAASDADSLTRMVDIGTGSMATNEFCDLNKMIAGDDATQGASVPAVCS